MKPQHDLAIKLLFIGMFWSAVSFFFLPHCVNMSVSPVCKSCMSFDEGSGGPESFHVCVRKGHQYHYKPTVVCLCSFCVCFILFGEVRRKYKVKIKKEWWKEEEESEQSTTLSVFISQTSWYCHPQPEVLTQWDNKLWVLFFSFFSHSFFVFDLWAQ